jgi:Zn-finger nucleic acid-binding protein
MGILGARRACGLGLNTASMSAGEPDRGTSSWPPRPNPSRTTAGPFGGVLAVAKSLMRPGPPARYSARVDCPACAGQLEQREVAGARLRRCGGCGGVLIGRPALARLREAPPSETELGDDAGARSPAPSPGGKAVTRTCPGCGRSMLGFAYGGGNTRVEGCDACEHLFLEHGELGAILHEARHGIALDEAAQRTLYQHRAWGTFSKIDSAEAGIATAGVAALYLFLRLVGALGALGASAFTVLPATALAAGLFVWRRRRLRAQKERAGERLERMKEAELWRIEQAARAASTARPAPEPGGALPSSSPGTASKSAACPFCRARLPAGTTHCSACDTDFG